MIYISANNEEVALADASFAFLVEVVEESLSWVSIIIVIVQVTTLLGIYAWLARCVVAWAIKGIDTKESTISALITCPAPAT